MNMFTDKDQQKSRIEELLDRKLYGNIDIVTDGTDFMRIHRGQVYQIDGRQFFIKGDMHEPRFGLPDQPKFWVKRAIDIQTGADLILKLVFLEDFTARIGPLRIFCFRSPQKESDVLSLVKGDSRFMQGETLTDKAGNNVRAIDFIKGESLYEYVINNPLEHEEYFHQKVPWLLRNVAGCFEAISFLHENNFCHGDIRNDHILIERDTNHFRWIDFDLKQYFSDFDIWSVGNILNFIMGKGIRTFHEVIHNDGISDHKKLHLTDDDASAFWNYRVMNLRKLFPYIPEKLNNILLHFAVNTNNFYESVDHIISDLKEATENI